MFGQREDRTPFSPWILGFLDPSVPPSSPLVFRMNTGMESDRTLQSKATKLYKKAAMQGQVQSRFNLGCCVGKKGNHNRTVRHFLISAKLGDKESVEIIKRVLTLWLATKAQFGEALKGYHDAAEEMKSHDRDETRRRN
ncbi:hypothetical protein THAOC_15353 [Thalassiosira oceanica]|uniref:Uncharacterized protein n=1 Tax=Thalassiosira oceanica TaxID=159749 RepID=K0SSC2_THAOC|nr:hypothetical protein THAOC_15353 [Thalassiosira oceanica]|eukprot:EJK63961.1 hypothetical protein THAOC_15353 [Thalassiosira oceanica]